MPEIDAAVLEKTGRRTTMRLSSILDSRVFDAEGRDLGAAHDVLSVRDGPKLGEFGPALRLDVVLAGSGAFGDRLGYEREDVLGPWPLRALFSHLHKRRAVAFGWSDIAVIHVGEVRLKVPCAELRSVDDVTRGRKRSETVYLALRVLDKQIIDKHGHMAGNVDDLELVVRARGEPYVSAILAGPGALAHRLGGRLGIWVESIHRRLHPEEGQPARTPFDLVKRIGTHVDITAAREDLDVNRFEDWVRDRIIAKIPGA